VHANVTYLISLLLGFLPLLSYGNQDTIPPIFTIAPQNLEVSCDSDYESEFDLWFSSQANSEADNGEATVLSEIPLPTALDSLRAAIAQGCDLASVPVNFFALDSCGNRSEATLQGLFTVTDFIPPSLSVQAHNLSVICNTTTEDSLNTWLNVYGGAVATDLCSDSIVWVNYAWTDSRGNAGFADFSEETDIRILRDSCEWSVDVSFFVADPCGNNNVTTATFSVLAENEPPLVLSSPPDLIIHCSDPLPNLSPEFIDGCSDSLMVEEILTSEQSQDETLCDYYNYNLTRRWIATDACGNTVDTFQLITVVDTLPPTFDADNNLALDCDTDLNEIESMIAVTDACSTVTLEFSDKEIFSSACQNQFERLWLGTDVCGNVDSFSQIIQIQDFSGPTFTRFPTDTLISCSENNLEQIFQTWANDIGGGTIEDNCNIFFSKALPPDVYEDTAQVIATPLASFNGVGCNNVFGSLSTQQVSLRYLRQPYTERSTLHYRRY